MSRTSSIDTNNSSTSKRMKLAHDDNSASTPTTRTTTTTTTTTTTSLAWTTNKDQKDDKDIHVHVLVTLEYHGTDYGGWQRQGPNNKIVYPSVQGTLEQAVTEACHMFATANANADDPQSNYQAPESSSDIIRLIPTTDDGDCRAVMAGTSGRTDRAVHAWDHHCLLRLPLAKSMLYTTNSGLATFLMGQPATLDVTSVTSSPFLTAVNAILPCDIHVLTCQTMTQKQRKELHFCRKRYCYIIQQAPTTNAAASNAATNAASSSSSSSLLNRPWPAWNDYTFFVKQPLDVTQMQQALSYMVGRHNFLPLSCHKDKIHTVRTVYSATITVVEHPFEDENDDDDDEEEEDANNGDNTITSNRQRQRRQRLPWFQKAVRKSSLLASTSKQQDDDDHDHECNHSSLSSSSPLSSSSSSSIFSPPHYGAAHLTVHPKNKQLRPELYKFICIEVEGNGFLKHQVRRMVSVLQKVGEGVWPPEIVLQILHENNNNNNHDNNIHHDNNNNNNNNNNATKDMKQKTVNGDFLKGLALAPARALFKAKVWMGDDRKDVPIIAPTVM